MADEDIEPEKIIKDITKQIHPGLLCKYVFLSILIGIIFVWIGSVNKWIAVYAINELCNIFPIEENKTPYANEYYKKFLEKDGRSKVMQGKFMTNNVEWQALTWIPGIGKAGISGAWRYWFKRNYWKSKGYEEKETIQKGGALQKVPLGPPLTRECPKQYIVEGDEDAADGAESKSDLKDGIYFPYNLFKRVCLYNNPSDDNPYECNIEIDSIEWEKKNERGEVEEVKKEYYIENKLTNLIKTWVNGYVIATISSWILMRQGVTRITGLFNDKYIKPRRFFWFFVVNIFKILSLIVWGVGGGVGGFLKGWWEAVKQTRTIIGPIIILPPFLVLNYVLQILSGIVTFLFFPLFQSNGFKQCYCIFKNNWGIYNGNGNNKFYTIYCT